MESVLKDCENVLQPEKDLDYLRKIINDGFLAYSIKRFGAAMNVQNKLPESMEPVSLRKFFRDVDLGIFWFGTNGYLFSNEFEIIMDSIDYSS